MQGLIKIVGRLSQNHSNEYNVSDLRNYLESRIFVKLYGPPVYDVTEKNELNGACRTWTTQQFTRTELTHAGRARS